nr:cytochrome P450 76AH88 [Isodon rubescens]
MDLLAVIVVVCLCALAWSHLEARNLPPGPFPLPIVGNILQMWGQSPHKSLHKLAKRYGPVMSLHLGGLFTVVVTAPELAKEVLSGQVFTARPGGVTDHKDHDKVSIATLPTESSEWRNLRKICHEHLFSRQSLGKSRGFRHKNMQLLLDYLQKFCDNGQAVNVREALLTSSVNFMSATLFSSDDVTFDSRVTSEFKEILDGIITFVKDYSYADFLPFLKSFDPEGQRRKLDFYHGRLLGQIKSQLDQRLEFRRANPNAPKRTDFLETLIDISQGSDYNLTLRELPYLLFDLYLATDTTIMTIEWVMTELLLHPDILSKVKDEVTSVVGDRKIIEDEDISRLPYLEALIKEVFRYHPVSYNIPRMPVQDCEIKGYFISKGTLVTVNVWAMNRDPSIWHNPDSFDPDRFLNSSIDLKGQCFELVPFGSGKRICPGMSLALLDLSRTVAALIHNFNWKFAPGERERNGDVISGVLLRREAPLMAIPLKYD